MRAQAALRVESVVALGESTSVPSSVPRVDLRPGDAQDGLVANHLDGARDAHRSHASAPRDE